MLQSCKVRLLIACDDVRTHTLCYAVVITSIYVHCRSVFYLPKPRPLNYLVQDLYGGPTLVLQGAKVPPVLPPPTALPSMPV